MIKSQFCIGCEKPCEEGLCKECESKLNTLEKALNGAGTRLELVEVKRKNNGRICY